SDEAWPRWRDVHTSYRRRVCPDSGIRSRRRWGLGITPRVPRPSQHFEIILLALQRLVRGDIQAIRCAQESAYMNAVARDAGRSRRAFMRDLAACGAAAVEATRPDRADPANAASLAGIVVAEPQVSGWKQKIGLELYTVRDQMSRDYEGVLARVAAIGYTEIEPANGYNDMPPAAFRSMLDRLGVTMPSTHSGATGTGADLEKQLEGFQIMGIRYTEISAAGRGGAGGGAGGAGRAGGGRPGGPLPPGAYFNAGTGVVHNAF